MRLPMSTTTLCYYGGLRVYRHVRRGKSRGVWSLTLMIAGMNTMEEAQGLLVARGVRYVIIPSWDPFFDEFARRYLAKNYSNRSSVLVRELREWNLPPLVAGGALPDTSRRRIRRPVGVGF